MILLIKQEICRSDRSQSFSILYYNNNLKYRISDCERTISIKDLIVSCEYHNITIIRHFYDWKHSYNSMIFFDV